MLPYACSFRRLAVLLLAASLHRSGRAADPGEQMAQQVYARLARAAGVVNPPKLVIQPAEPASPNRVAFLRMTAGPLPRREIVIEDKTIFVCRQLGPQSEACLAYFLGHELAHFANNHDWGAHFARQTGSVEHETQADRFGGFYAALAGYDSLSVAGKSLEMVYREYGIDSHLSGYLSLSERQKVPEAAREFLSGLLPMFDAGGLLMALGHYKEAAALYDAILDQFPSREIYNNAGVALASLYDAKAPWLMDGSTRLPEHSAQRGQVDLGAVSAQAREHFEKAIELDHDYAVAHWNLASLLKAIGDEPERAEAERKTAIRLAKGIDAIAARPLDVAPDGLPLERAALLPGGKRPADFLPARRDSEVQLANGLKFFSGTMNGFVVFSVGPLDPDRKRVIVVLLPKVPDEWRGRLGAGREIPVFPEKATLYDSLGVFIGLRGALVYQVR